MDVDYRLAFEMAPVGLALSRNRTMVDCNRHLCEMFGAAPEQLIGQSFQVLYPSVNRRGTYSDDRIMKRLEGRFKGDTFWCHVTGRALNQEAPHEAGIWTFEDLSASRPVKAELTGREREVAALLLDGLTSKEIGRTLAISHRTVEIYRAGLMRKYQASNTGDLVHKLMSG